MTEMTATTGTGAMPDASATPAAPTAAEETPATGGTSPEPTTTETAAGPLGPEGIEALSLERKARRDAEKRAKELEKALREREEAELSEQQRASLRLAELEAERTAWLNERQSVYLTAAVSQMSQRLALVDVDAVTRLLDRSALEYDDHGQPTNAEALVRALLREKPYLAGARQATPVQIGTTEGTTAAAPPNLTVAELEAARDAGLSPERYAALKSVRTIEDWQSTRRQPSTS